MRKIFAVLALMVAGVGLAACGGDAVIPRQTTVPADIAECRRAVLSKLKAPSTATLSPVADTTTEKKQVDSDKTEYWEVRGWVDAENSYSAKIRSTWICEVVKKPDGEWVSGGELVKLYGPDE